MTELAFEAWLDQDDRNIAMKIREFGIFIRYVYGEQDSEETPFAYTVGLFGLGHPELLIFGMNESSTAGVLNTMYERVRAGGDLTPGELVTLEDWPHRLYVEEVPNPAEIVIDVYRHYRYPPFEPLAAAPAHLGRTLRPLPLGCRLLHSRVGATAAGFLPGLTRGTMA